MLDQGLELGGIENLVLTYFIDYDPPAVEVQEPKWQQLVSLCRRCVMRGRMEDRFRH